MACRLVFRISSVIVCLTIAASAWAQPEVESPGTTIATPIPHQDILELFGDEATSAGEGMESPVVSEAGTIQSSSEAPGTGGSVKDEASIEIARPSPDEDGAAAGGWSFGRKDEANKTVARAGETGSWSLRDFLPLASVVALILIAAWVVKRSMPARRLLTGSGVLEIVARTPLSGKQTLVLVRMGPGLLLLGATPDRISRLGSVKDPEQVALMLGEIESTKPGSISETFTRSFNDESLAYSPEATGQDQAARASGPVRGLLDKVRQFRKKREVA